MKPPDDLKSWPKNELVREVRRLRAITREHAERRGNDPRAQATTGSAVTDVAGNPHAQGGAILDARAAVLMDSVDVVLVDTKRDEPVAMMLALAGRVNYADDRVEHAYLIGPDGAAALVCELVGLAGRAASSASEHGRRFGEGLPQHRRRTTGAPAMNDPTAIEFNRDWGYRGHGGLEIWLGDDALAIRAYWEGDPDDERFDERPAPTVVVPEHMFPLIVYACLGGPPGPMGPMGPMGDRGLPG